MPAAQPITPDPDAGPEASKPTPRTSFAWRLPSVRAIYSGDPKSAWRWFWVSAIGGWGMWKIWANCVWFIVRSGQFPSADRIGSLVVTIFTLAAEKRRD